MRAATSLQLLLWSPVRGLSVTPPVDEQRWPFGRTYWDIPSRRTVLMGTAAAAMAVHPAVAEAAAAPAVTFDFSTAPSGLQWADLKLGTGVAPQAGSALVIDYIMTRRAGEQIHSTVKAQEPFSWVLGSGTVIEGLEQAVAGGGGVPAMLPGGARRVIVPMALGYGKSADDQGLMWQTAVRENLGPIPPENFEWVDRRGDKVNSFFRFKSLYLNPNRFDQARRPFKDELGLVRSL